MVGVLLPLRHEALIKAISDCLGNVIRGEDLPDGPNKYLRSKLKDDTSFFHYAMSDVNTETDKNRIREKLSTYLMSDESYHRFSDQLSEKDANKARSLITEYIPCSVACPTECSDSDDAYKKTGALHTVCTSIMYNLCPYYNMEYINPERCYKMNTHMRKARRDNEYTYVDYYAMTFIKLMGIAALSLSYDNHKDGIIKSKEDKAVSVADICNLHYNVVSSALELAINSVTRSACASLYRNNVMTHRDRIAQTIYKKTNELFVAALDNNRSLAELKDALVSVWGRSDFKDISPDVVSRRCMRKCETYEQFCKNPWIYEVPGQSHMFNSYGYFRDLCTDDLKLIKKNGGSSRRYDSDDDGKYSRDIGSDDDRYRQNQKSLIETVTERSMRRKYKAKPKIYDDRYSRDVRSDDDDYLYDFDDRKPSSSLVRTRTVSEGRKKGKERRRGDSGQRRVRDRDDDRRR